MQTLAAVAAALPTSLVTRLARQQAQTVDFATSNVKAAPMPVYIAGAQLLENYPLGPLAGVAFNLTLLSYDGSLDMGVNIDVAAVTEPELLRNLMEESFAGPDKCVRTVHQDPRARQNQDDKVDPATNAVSTSGRQGEPRALVIPKGMERSLMRRKFF